MELKNLTAKAHSNGHSDLVADAYGPESLDVSLDELRERAIHAGVNPYTPGIKRKIEEERQRAQRRVLAERQSKVERWAALFATWTRSGIQWLAEFATLLVTVVAGYLLLPLSVFGLYVAEVSRSADGIRQFDAPRADLLAVVMVSTYTLLQFIRAQAEQHEPTIRWSWRLFFRQARYWLGFDSDWKPEFKTEDMLLKSTISISIAMIVLLGAIGTLDTEIAMHNGKVWYMAVNDILLGSDLGTFLNWLGGSFLSLMLLRASHFTINKSAQRYSELMDKGGADFFTSSNVGLAEADQAERLLLLSLIQRAEQKRQQSD